MEHGRAGRTAAPINQASRGVLKWPKRPPGLACQWWQRWEGVGCRLCPWPLTRVLSLSLRTQDEEEEARWHQTNAARSVRITAAVHHSAARPRKVTPDPRRPDAWAALPPSPETWPAQAGAAGSDGAGPQPRVISLFAQPFLPWASGLLCNALCVSSTKCFWASVCPSLKWVLR